MKKQNGITIVSLVITIIVLLILTGVSISQIIGTGGILDRTEQTINDYDSKQIKDDINWTMRELEKQYDDGYYKGTIEESSFSEYILNLTSDEGIKTKNENVLRIDNSGNVIYKVDDRETTVGTFNNGKIEYELD